MIDTGWLTFQEDGPNVKTNPFASHGGPAVNAIEECGLQSPKQLKDMITSRRFILKALREAGISCIDGGEVSQPTLRREGDARLTGTSSKEGKRVESPPTFIRGKCRKNQNGKGRRFAYFENEGSGVVYARGRY